MSKLPIVTLSFWIMKICATTLGETAGDLFSMTLNGGYALSSLMLMGVFIVTLTLQLVAKTYIPLLFWGVIVSTSTVGTTISDYMDRTLELGYPLGASILIVILLCILLLWRWVEGTISIGAIKTRKSEAFYWVAILISNTLGTALGDFLADSFGLGFSGGALLVGSFIGLTVVGYYFTTLSRTFLFWTAFVLTRPFGAMIGDLLTKPLEKGGVDFGTIGSSLLLSALLLSFIVYAYWEGHRYKTNA